MFPAIVHTYTDALRLLEAEPGLTIEAVAERTGRVKSNVRRDWPKVVEAEVVESVGDGFSLTDKGARWVKGIEVAEGRASLTRDTSDPANLSLCHDEILPDPDNARRDWTSDDAVADLEALATDIRDNGLLQNLIVRRNPDAVAAQEWILVGGERRWRALGLLIERGEWLADQTVPARRLNADDLGIRLAALAENLQRRALNPIEEATAYRGLREAGLTTEQIAERVTMTQRHVQGRLQLLDLLSEDQQRRMTLPGDDKDRLSVSDARKLVQNAEAKAKAREKLEADLSPRARLIFAEVRIANPSWYGRVQVDAIAMNADADADALNQAGYLKLPTTVDLEGVANTSIEHGGFDVVTRLFGDTGEDSVTAYAARMRADLGLPAPEEGTFSTAWLNGPFVLPPEVEADLAARRAARAKEDEEREAQTQANIRLREAAVQRHALSRVHAESLLTKAAAAPAAPIIDDVPQLAASLDRRLPWAATEKGQVLDADGYQVMTFCARTWQSAGDREIALAMLTATAVNTAAGIETPPLLVTAEPEQAVDGSDPDADEDDDVEEEA
jgi:ParB/RepB/Spo0J family partition protein